MRDCRISRRRMLATVGTVTSGLVAGCSGSSTERDPSETGGKIVENRSEFDFDGFVEADGTQLVVGGEPIYLAGTAPGYVLNLYRPDDVIDTMFNHIAQQGLTLARVHVLQPFWGDENKQPEPGETSESVLSRFDRIIEAAQKRGIRLSASFINAGPAYPKNYDDDVELYGVNVTTYVEHAESANSINDFYTKQECIDLYKQRVQKVLTRKNTRTGVEYRNDPTIAMWELGNEIEYTEPWTLDDPTLQPWIDEMSTHVKSIDDNHLVTTGEYGWADRNNYVADHEPDSVDVCSLHYYPGPNGGYDLPNDPERDHPDRLRNLIQTGHEDLEKPVYVGEYNWKVEPGSKPPLSERNKQLAVMHDVFDDMDVAMTAHHALTLDSREDFSRGQAITYADVDDETMSELQQYAGVQYDKSADSTLPEFTPFE